MKKQQIDSAIIFKMIDSIAAQCGMTEGEKQAIMNMPANKIIGINDVCRTALKSGKDLSKYLRQPIFENERTLFDEFYRPDFDFYKLINFAKDNK